MSPVVSRLSLRWIVFLSLLILPPAAEAQSPPILPAQLRTAIIDSLARTLRARYVDSATGVRLAEALQRWNAEGRYATMSSPAPFAERLMQDMATIVRDQHLRVTYDPATEYAAAVVAPRDSAVVRTLPNQVVRTRRNDPRDSATIARSNFGFVRAERLPGNIGYLKLNRFVPLDYSRPTAIQALGFLASTDAMIIDLRDNIGGSPDLVAFMLSHFYGPAPVTLFTTRNRGLNLTNTLTTLAEVPGRRKPETDLYVLTSGNTASAAEAFAYAVRLSGRGTVIGATTSGAGNGGTMLSLGGGVALFLPEWKVMTGPGWEGIGVAPDSLVPPETALTAAHTTAARRLLARAPTPERRVALQRELDAAGVVPP